MPAAKTATPVPARAPATAAQASLYQQLRGHLAALKLHDAGHGRRRVAVQPPEQRRLAERIVDLSIDGQQRQVGS